MRRCHLLILFLFVGCREDASRPPVAPAQPVDADVRAETPTTQVNEEELEARQQAALAREKEKSRKATNALAVARKGFQTKLIRQDNQDVMVATPPPHLFRVVQYESPAGMMSAYISKPPAGRGKLPAIIWKIGGFSNSIGPVWGGNFPAENDQSASAFWKAGIITMYPSVRGGNRNPGYKEGFFGEVDDIIAAAEYLATQDRVDPDRIYLGGHSTGGTLALLVGASTDRFRAIFALGPADEVEKYRPEDLPYDLSVAEENRLRSPIRWLQAINSPVFLFEGLEAPGNADVLSKMALAHKGSKAHFYPVPKLSHFSLIKPLTGLIAAKILADVGPKPNITFTPSELANLARPRSTRE